MSELASRKQMVGGAIICAACQTRKSLADFFSKNQRTKGANARCKDCVSQQTRKVTMSEPPPKKQKVVATKICSVCQTPKSIEDCFSKTQRSMGAKARCIECIVVRQRNRQCTACLKSQSRGKFSKSQWRNEVGRQCKDCLSPEQEVKLRNEEMRKQRELQDQRRARERKQAARVRMALGIDFYECPMDKGVLDFEPVVPLEEELVGTYDILYYSTEMGIEDEWMNRTTKQELTLVWKEDNDENRVLVGDVKIDPDYKDTSGFLLCGDLEFEHKNIDNKDSIAFKVVQYPCDVLEYRAERVLPDGAFVILKVVSKRAALGWRAHERPQVHESKSNVTFDSLEEAETIMKIFEDYDYSDSWLCRHMSLPASLAKIIHEFAVRKPKPVFFIEKGDLRLEVTYSDDRDPACVWYIARRRSK